MKQYTLRAIPELMEAYHKLDPIFLKTQVLRRITGYLQYDRIAIRPREVERSIDLLELEDQKQWAKTLNAMSDWAKTL